MSSLLLFYESTFSFPELSLLTEEEKTKQPKVLKNGTAHTHTHTPSPW